MSQIEAGTTSLFDRKRSSFGFTYKNSLSPFQRKESRREKLSKSSLQQSIQLTNNFIFSVTSIIFYYNCNGQSQHLVNKDLKLTNKTGIKVGFKIKCNNPQNYQVTPTQQKVQQGSSVVISIKLSITPTTNALKFNSDKFQIQWGRIDELNVVTYVGKQVLPVQVKTDNLQLRNFEVKKEIEISNQEIKLYKNLITTNLKRIQELEQQLNKVRMEPQPWVISQTLGILLAITAFVIGYLIF